MPRLRAFPEGPHVAAIAEQVRGLLADGGLSQNRIAAALDVLALLASEAALDRGPWPAADPEEEARRRRNLTWQIDIVLGGLAASPAPPA